MSSHSHTIAIYWDLDCPPAQGATTGWEPERDISATIRNCLALARTVGNVGVQRAVGGPVAHRARLARWLARNGVETVLALPSPGRRRDDRLIGMIECLALDLWAAIDGVVMISARPDLGAAERFVRSAGRRWVVLRGLEDAARMAHEQAMLEAIGAA